MRRNAMRSTAALIVGAFLTLLPGLAVASPAAAYPAKLCATLQVSTTVASVGEQIGVTGVNFDPNADVALVLKPAPGNTTASSRQYPLKTVTAGPDGSFSTQIVMPNATTGQGNFTLFAASGAPNSANCPADPVVNVTLSAAGKTNLTNPDTNANGAPGSTAFTGVNVMIMLLVAAALLVTGVAFSRRGRTPVSR